MPNIYLGPKGIITAEEAAQMQVVVYGACPYPDYVTTFESLDEFRKWSETLPEKDRIAQALQKTELAKATYEKDPFAAMAAQQATIKAIRVQMEGLAEKTGLDPNSHELFLKATVDADPIAGPIFRSAQLFEHPNCTGRRLDIRSWQWYPNLAWLGFDDMISSVRVHAWSILVLCEHSNFQGQWTWFFGGLWWSNEFNLDHGINDTASSAICIGF
jgi:hypothetical protein